MITEYVYAFHCENKPVYTAQVGEKLVFRTLDCFSNKIRSEDHLVDVFDFNEANPATGPVFVEGAEPGDILVAEIHAIELDSQGVVTTLPGVGPLAATAKTRTKVLEVKNGTTLFNDVTIPLRPMVGVIGVAPAKDSICCGFPGAHGGNLDSKLMEAGSILYLPVRVKGALFQLGDLHAVMGDGELCGTGMEIAGKVTVTLSLIKQTSLDWPVLETADKWYAMASDIDYTTALTAVSEQMQKLIVKAYGWDETDSYLYLSLCGDLEINQACQPCPVPMVLRIGVPKIANKPLIKKA